MKVNIVATEQAKLLSDINIRLVAIEKWVKETAKWLRFQNLLSLKQVLENELGDDAKKLAYESTDGTRGYREVGNASGVPATTVQSWWNRWFNLGILEESDIRKGRMKHICSLKEVGIEIPKRATAKGKLGKQQLVAEQSQTLANEMLKSEVGADEEAEV